jgi:CheY-like chemotaxis protein
MDEKKRILVVDDEQDVCESLKSFLGRRGYEATIAVTGLQAVEILAKETFPVVLLDLKMPYFDGWQVLKAVRPDHPDTKFIVVTGFLEPATNSSAGTEEELRQLGVYDFILKPIRMKEIYEMLEKMYT